MERIELIIKEFKLDFPMLGGFYRLVGTTKWNVFDTHYKISVVLSTNEKYEYKGIVFSDANGIPIASSIPGYASKIPIDFLRKYAAKPTSKVTICYGVSRKDVVVLPNRTKLTYTPVQVKSIVKAIEAAMERYKNGKGEYPDFQSILHNI